MNDLHLDTPLARAIFEILANMEEVAIDMHSDLKPGDINVLIFGGCAIHIYTNARGSQDLDAEIQALHSCNLSDILIELDPVYYTDPEKGDLTLDLDGNFNTGLPPLPSNYRDNVIRLHQNDDSVIHIALVGAATLAVSKLGRFAESDQDDIKALYLKKCFSLKEFEEAAQDAIDYSATPSPLIFNTQCAIEMLKNLDSD